MTLEEVQSSDLGGQTNGITRCRYVEGNPCDDSDRLGTEVDKKDFVERTAFE